jgi:tetratricopeptide (TPR) repeat protein
VFSPEQLLERLSRRLDLLTGERDADPRQQTIRATIEWSHDLLSPEEQGLFRRLAVFVGGATLEAAEEVCLADADVLQALADKSLAQRRDDAIEPRFWMLESIGDFARERLAASGEEREVRGRHATHFRALASRMDAELLAGEPEEGPVAVLDADIDNLRAAAAFGLETGDTRLVRAISAALPMYWLARGLYAEARSWLERAIALEPDEDDMRRRLLSSLAVIAYSQGDHVVAVATADDAAALAMRLGGVTERYAQLRDRAFASFTKGDLGAAEALWEQAFVAATAADNGVGMSSCRINLSIVANRSVRHERAEALLGENLPFVRSRGQTRCEATTLALLAETSVRQARPRDAAEDALEAARRARQIDDAPLTAYALDLFAVAAAARGEPRIAGSILGATEAAREAMGVGPDEDEQAMRDEALELLRGAGDRETAWNEGRALDLEAAFELAASARAGAAT